MLRKFLPLIFIFISYTAFACDSDCYQCHSNIPKDKEHKVLSTCTKCHPTHSKSAFKDKCGADCFECHSLSKVIKTSASHKVLEKCIKCHKKLKSSDLNSFFYNSLLK